MTTSNRLFGNISNIYKATAQSQIFRYCASYNYFPTAHLPIICLLQIDKIFRQLKSSTCLFTLHRNIVEELQIDYWETSTIHMATTQSPIFRLIRIYYFPTANAPIIFLLQIEQLFQHCKSSKHSIAVHRKSLWQLQIAYFEIFRRLI